MASQYGLYFLGCYAGYNGIYKRSKLLKLAKLTKICLNRDQRLKLIAVNEKYIVIVRNHSTVNTPLLFTHTAHQASQEEFL